MFAISYSCFKILVIILVLLQSYFIKFWEYVSSKSQLVFNEHSLYTRLK